MNYSGDLVCEPSQAAMMQLGEGLHLMNLVAANASGAYVVQFTNVADQCLLMGLEID